MSETPKKDLTPQELFAKWLEEGPRLAKEAGCYVGIKVTALKADPRLPTPSRKEQ